MHKEEMGIVQEIKLKQYLKDKCGYTELQVRQTIEAVNQMNQELRKQLMEFLVTKQLPRTVIEEVTLRDFIEKLDMNPITAFLALDYLLTNPEEAKYILTKRQEKLEIDEQIAQEKLDMMKNIPFVENN